MGDCHHHHHHRKDICDNLREAIKAIEKAREALKEAAEDTSNCFIRALLHGFATTLKGVLEGLRAVKEEECKCKE